MKVLDLFAGIGGFSLAAHWMGWETAAFVEWDEFCQKVLAKNFPNVPIFGDIKQFDGTEYNRSVDLICGGFPCQPFSTAGRRKGKNDDRYLWPEMLRVIRQVKPTWIVGENVAGIVTMEDGTVLEGILIDLESEGYTTETIIIPACAVQAPHRRDRVWIIANATSERLGKTGQYCKRQAEWASGSNNAFATNTNDGGRVLSIQRKQKRQKLSNATEYHSNAANTNSQQNHTANAGRFHTEFSVPDWGSHWYETATRLCGIHDGIPGRMDKHRSKRLKALGNAVVPQVVFEIFKAIQELENINL